MSQGSREVLKGHVLTEDETHGLFVVAKEERNGTRPVHVKRWFN